MKIENTKKFVAVLTAFSLAFLQAVPVGGAVVNTNTLAGSDSGPTLTKAVGDTAEDSSKNQTPPAPAKTPLNTTDFQMSALSPLSASTTAPDVTASATESTLDGKVSVSGSVTPNAKVYYSIKQGDKYLKEHQALETSTPKGKFDNKIVQLPSSGTYDIVIYAENSSAERSEEVTLTRTCTTPVPELTKATIPTANGKADLEGTVTPGFDVYYSIKQGDKYLKQDNLLVPAADTATGTWSKKDFQLTGSGTYDILIYARKTSSFKTGERSFSLTCTVPAPTVTATPPTTAGKVTLSGTTLPSYDIYYSLDGGKNYSFVQAKTDGSWDKEITLDKDTANTICVYARKTSSFKSETVNLLPAPTASLFTSTLPNPDSNGKVTLSGKAVAGYKIFYSVDGGVNWTDSKITAAAKTGDWKVSGIALQHAGDTNILVAARTTGSYAIQGSATTVPVNFPVATPTVTLNQLPDTNGKTAYDVTGLKGYTVYYSLNGGDWIDSKAVIPTTGSGTTGKITATVALQREGDTAIRFCAIKKVAPTAVFQSAASEPVTAKFPVATPTAVVKTQPNADGKTTYDVTGLKGYTVYYSLDGGAWVDSKAVIPTTGTGTTGKITATVALQKEGDTAIRFSVVKKVLPTAVFQSAASEPVTAKFPVTTPTAKLSSGTTPNPDVNGKVKMEGTAPAGYVIHYSLDNGVTWNLTSVTVPTTGKWVATGIPLQHAGETNIQVRAVKKVPPTAVFQSAASEPFSVKFPVDPLQGIKQTTQPSVDGKVNFEGTGSKQGYAIYYSLDGGEWKPSGAAISTTTGKWTATVQLEKAGETQIRFSAIKKVAPTAVFQSAASDNFPVKFSMTKPLFTATDPTPDGKVKLNVKKGPVGYTLYYSLDGGETYNPAVATEFNSSGDWNKTINLSRGGETEFCAYFKKGTLKSETASVKVSFEINAPYDVIASVPNSAGAIFLEGKRMNASDSVYYSTDGGGTYQILNSFSGTGTGTGWKGQMTLPDFTNPAVTTTLMLAIKTTAGFLGEPVVVGAYTGLTPIERTVVGYLNYLQELFFAHPDYVITVKPDREVDPRWYTFTVIRFDQPGDGHVRHQYPGELALLKIDMKVQRDADDKAVLVNGQRVFEEPVAQHISYDTPLLRGGGPTVYPLTSGLAQLLPPTQIDPRLVIGVSPNAVNMNALKMIPDVELVFVESSPYIIHIKYQGKSYRIFRDTTTTPESYKIVEEGTFTEPSSEVHPPSNVTATTPTSTGLVSLKGVRANPGDSIYYSFDGGLSYQFLTAGGGSTMWGEVDITIPSGQDVTLSIISVTAEGLSSFPVRVNVYNDLVPVYK